MDVGILDAMQHHIHRTDTKHGLVCIIAGEKTGLKVSRILRLHQLCSLVRDDVGTTLLQEAGAPHGRVKNLVFESRLHELHHHVDNVARGSELAVFAGSGNLAEQVFIDIAHEVFVVHVQGIDAIHHLGQHIARGNEKHRVFHVSAECRIHAFTNRFNEREHIVANVFQHSDRLKVVENTPA